MIRRQRQSRRSGFTLLEVLVASVMVATIAASLYAALHAAFKARHSAMDGLDTLRSARLAIEAVGRDLQTAMPPTGILAGQFAGDDSTGENGHDSDTVTFYCPRPGTTSPSVYGEVRQITFILLSETDWANENGKDTAMSDASPDRFVLVRRVRTNLTNTVQDDPADIDEQVICRGVTAFNVRYYDGSDWLDSWDASTGSLPMAVEVTLEVAAVDATSGSSCKLIRVFQPPCATPSTTGIPLL